MPSLDDFAAARQAAFDCANAAISLLNVARKAVPEGEKAEWIARRLDQLARALVDASGAISSVEDDLIRAAVPNGTVKAGGMECATAHRLALDLASYLGNTIREIDPGLVPRGLTPKWPPPRKLGVDAELVSKHLPVIVAKLAARPPFDAQHVESRIQHEWAGATDRLASARHEPARPTEAPSADARAALEHLRSRFREEAGRHPGFRHMLIEAPGPAALPDVMELPPAIEGGKTFAETDKEHGRIWVFIDGDWPRCKAARDALGTLAGTAIGMLSELGIFRPTEPPPDTNAPWVHAPEAWMKAYHAREWLLFLHRQARERPGAPPGLRSTPYVGSLKLSEGASADALVCGVFEASALILGRLWTEATEQARPAPPAGPPAAPPLPKGPFKVSRIIRPFLTPRRLPDAVVSMATPAGRVEMVRLADCEAWTPGGWDIIWLPDGRWAVGFWCDGAYAPAWTDHAFRLAEVPIEVVVGICDRCGTDYPPALVRAMTSSPPVDEPSGTGADTHQAPPPKGERDAASPAGMPKDAQRFIMGPPSPLLGDPDWIAGFRWLTERLLGTAQKLARHGSMTPYCHMLIETEWKPTLDGLAAHVLKVAEDFHNGPPIRPYALQGNVPDAYQLAYAMLGELSRNDRPGVAPIPITSLEAIRELLADWKPPADPLSPVASDGRTEAAASPLEDRQIDGAGASGEAPAPETLAQKLLRLWPRRKLQAALVKYMEDRLAAPYADVASNVHGSDLTDGRAIEQLVIRTNETLVELRAVYYFRCGGEHVFRDPIQT